MWEAGAAPGEAPGGVSRVLHIRCGYHCSGSPAWQAEHDHATLTKGYGYSVRGNSFRGNYPGGYCWFFSQGGFEIRCPKNVEGTLYLHFLDMNNAERSQTITVCGKYTDIIEDFGQPHGKWTEYKLTKEDTSAGAIDVEIVRNEGANAVISRIEFVPSGMKDALEAEGPLPKVNAKTTVPEMVYDEKISDPKAMVEQDWRAQEQLKRRVPGCREAVAEVLSRGDALLQDLRALGADEIATAACAQLAACRRTLEELNERQQAGGNVAGEWEKLYFDTRWIVRRAAFENPLLGQDEGLLFVRRHHATQNHQCSRRRSRYNGLGGEICVLTEVRADGPARVVPLTEGRFPEGLFGRPDISFDGKRIVFGFAAADVKDLEEPACQMNRAANSIGNGTFYQLWEMDLDGKTEPRRITDGTTRREESTDPIYLPNGRIAFMSPRAGGMVQCGDWAWADCMFTINPDGSDIRQITRSKEGEWDPCLMDDGTITFTRWEYVMRFWQPTQLIWNVRPDGTYPRIVAGYLTGERNYARCRQIPGTSKVVCVESHHHNDGSGNILVVDLEHGRDTATGERRVVIGSCDCPYPLDENYFLISYDPNGTGTADNRAAKKVAIYLADVHGGLELVYRDPHFSAMYPTPIRPRPRPPVLPELDPAEGQPFGEFVLQDVHLGLPESMQGKARYLRIVEAHQRHIHTSPCNIWVGMGGFETKAVLGTVPIESDGSAHFQVPADKAVFFSVLDENYQALHTMRMTTDVKPGESVGCVGCHEPMTTTPVLGKSPLAMRHPIRTIKPPPWGTGTIGFPKHIQPILDKHCTRCHDGTEGKDKSFDLRACQPASEVFVPNVWTTYGEQYRKQYAYRSYWTLLKHVSYADIHQYDTPPGSWGSRVSPLMELLAKGHEDVELSPAEWRTLCVWIDCNIPYLDDYRKFAVDPELREACAAGVAAPPEGAENP
jgi:hypothetical protein